MIDEKEHLQWQHHALPYAPDALITARPERMRKLVMRSFIDEEPAFMPPVVGVPQPA